MLHTLEIGHAHNWERCDKKIITATYFLGRSTSSFHTWQLFLTIISLSWISDNKGSHWLLERRQTSDKCGRQWRLTKQKSLFSFLIVYRPHKFFHAGRWNLKWTPPENKIWNWFHSYPRPCCRMCTFRRVRTISLNRCSLFKLSYWLTISKEFCRREMNASHIALVTTSLPRGFDGFSNPTLVLENTLTNVINEFWVVARVRSNF